MRHSLLACLFGRMALALGLAVVVGALHAQSVPSLINYQGQISSPDGSVPATADYELSFSIHDADKGGTQIWGPQRFNGISGPGLGAKIPVVQGYFNVMLGPVDTNSRSISTAFSNATRYLEIKVGTNPPVAPRQRILSAPYALRADLAQMAVSATRADAATTADSVADAVVTLSKLSPQLLLDVIVPPGSVMPYMGTNPPPGWFLCDGTPKNRVAFARLFAVMGEECGKGDGITTFNIPDFRGLFLRGADHGVGRDVDHDARVGMNAGALGGDQLGSVQSDLFARHDHGGGHHTHDHGAGPAYEPSSGKYAPFGLANDGAKGNALVWPGNLTIGLEEARSYPIASLGITYANNFLVAQGGSETRPVNAYVNYIIKY